MPYICACWLLLLLGSLLLVGKARSTILLGQCKHVTKICCRCIGHVLSLSSLYTRSAGTHTAKSVSQDYQLKFMFMKAHLCLSALTIASKPQAKRRHNLTHVVNCTLLPYSSSSLQATTSYLCLLTPLNCEEQVVSPVGKRGLRRLLVALREPAALPLLDGRLLHCNPSVSLQLSSSIGSSAWHSGLSMMSTRFEDLGQHDALSGSCL